MATALPATLLRAVVYVPLIVMLLIPLACVAQFFVFIRNQCAGKVKEGGKSDATIEDEKRIISKYKEGSTKRSAAREYDLVLFGATGFTGRLAALYIAKTYGLSRGGFKWAIAGITLYPSP